MVYEPEKEQIGENLVAIQNNWHYERLLGAQKKVKKLKENLQKNDFHVTPMLEVHPKANSYEYFTSLITSPYVISNQVGSSERTSLIISPIQTYEYSIPSDLDNYFKPLDIV